MYSVMLQIEKITARILFLTAQKAQHLSMRINTKCDICDYLIELILCDTIEIYPVNKANDLK